MSDMRRASQLLAAYVTAGSRAAQRVDPRGGLTARRYRATVISVDDVAGTAVVDVLERGGTVQAWRQGFAAGAGALAAADEVYVDALGDGVWVIG